jgi:uncharacterized protein YdhG (YjbR/CyaY superfamily)
MNDVDAYVAKQPPVARAVLARVRSAIRKALPGATEVISYGIPAFKVDGRAVIFLSAWKNHWSLYPASDLVRTELAKELAGALVAKGTMQFAYDDVRTGLIAKIARLRAQEAAHDATKKTATKKTPTKKTPTKKTPTKKNAPRKKNAPATPAKKTAKSARR